MQDDRVSRWREQFETAMAAEEETDLEPLWNEVGAAIDRHPDHAGLRRLRAHMAESFGIPAVRHEDLLALHRIDPADREAELTLATVQLQWARLIAPEDDDGTRAAEIESEARHRLLAMLRTHRSDAGFCAQVLEHLAPSGFQAPWQRLTAVLEAAAAHPGDERFERELASAWESLSNFPPENYDFDNPTPPVGFLYDVAGSLWDPFLQERALQAIARLLERHPDEADLWLRRARILEARCDFPAAAEAYATASARAKRALPQASSDDAREALERLDEEGATRAGLCREGRARLARSLAEDMDCALEQLGRPTPVREGASEAARAAAAELDRLRQEQSGELHESVAAFRAAMEAQVAKPDQVESIRAFARQLAGNVVGSIVITPFRILPLEPPAFEADWAEAMRPVRDGLASLGWRDIGWAEWPDYRPLVGHQVVTSVWTDPQGATVALAGMVKGIVSLDLETELSNGRWISTSLSRGRNCLLACPELDPLLVEPALAIPDACALHAARRAHTLALSRDATCRPCGSLEDMAAMQERGRALKTRARLASGLSESESLAVPHDFPEIFAPMFREAVSAAIADLRAATRL